MHKSLRIPTERWGIPRYPFLLKKKSLVFYVFFFWSTVESLQLCHRCFYFTAEWKGQELVLVTIALGK